MSSAIFNIVWVDDEIDSLYRSKRENLVVAKRNRETCQNKQVNIFPARDISEFERQMNQYGDRIDAVITDINFSAYGDECENEARDVSGYDEIKQLICKYQTFGREILFYIFSGKLDLINEGKEKRFEGRIFRKSDEFSCVLDKIIEDVKLHRTPGYRVREKYHEELNAASIIPQNEEFLYRELVKDESGENRNEKGSPFNEARQVIERMFMECKRLEIIPSELVSMNDLPRFLGGRHDVFVLCSDSEIMHPVLIESLKYVLKLTQDGSHDGNENLKLKVNEYANLTNSKNVYRSVLHLLMELCLWYNEYVSKHLSVEDNKGKWFKKEEAVQKFYGSVEEDGDGDYHCGEYLVSWNDGKRYVGKKVCIAVEKTSVNNNARNKDKYNLFAPSSSIKEC